MIIKGRATAAVTSLTHPGSHPNRTESRIPITMKKTNRRIITTPGFSPRLLNLLHPGSFNLNFHANIVLEIR